MCQESQDLLKEFQECSKPLIDAFEMFVHENRDRNETFKYWDTFMQLTSLLEDLIRSDREGNWELHVHTVQALLSVFAAFDSTNYLRWCSLYLEDMRMLPETAPTIHLAFVEGKFVVKRTVGQFKSVGADMALEQTFNKSQKGSSGIIGSSRKKKFVAKWEIIYHEMLAISNLHRELSGVNTSGYDLVVNHEFNRTETSTGEINVQAMLEFIEKHENPFQAIAGQLKLHNIITQEVMTDDIRDQLLNVTSIGHAAYESLRKDRFIDKTVRFCETIHRTNLKTFQSIHKSTKDRNISGKAVKHKEEGCHNRILEVARVRGSTMEELLQYDVMPTSCLFDSEGFMSKAVKSTIVHELERELTAEDQKVPQRNEEFHTTYIVDMMGNIRKLRTKGLKTFGEFCEVILDYICKSTNDAKRIDHIFDSYIEKSLKDSERKRRQTKSPIELNQINTETSLPVEMDRFWTSSSNKRKLQVLLHQQVIAKSIANNSPLQMYVSHMSGEPMIPCRCATDGSTEEVHELHVECEEADTRIIPHAMHAVTNGTDIIVVMSSDTDVFVLMMYYWRELNSNGLRELWIKTGVGDSTRYIPVHTLTTRVGREMCSVLPAVHTITGCDYTSKLGTKHAALKANPVELLKDFGHHPNSSHMESLMESSEEYLTRVLKSGTKCTTMNQLRTYMYHHSKGISLDQLPPTSHATKAHILRECYATHQMVSILSSEQEVLDPTQYGFVEVDELLMPDMSIKLIPEEYAVQCTCTKCANIRCICRRNGVACCKFCKCQGVSATLGCRNPSGCV